MARKCLHLYTFCMHFARIEMDFKEKVIQILT